MAGQDDEFRALMLDGLGGGYVPEYAPAPAIGVSPDQQSQEAERFRSLMSAGIGGVPGVGALAPYADGINVGAKTLGALSNPLSAAMGVTEGLMQPGVGRRVGQVALGLPHDRPDGVTTRTRDAEPSDLQPMNMPQVAVQPAPTLAASGSPARSMGGGGGSAGFGGLERGFRDAQGRQLRTLDDTADLEVQAGIDKAAKTLAESDLREADALARMRDAEENARIEAAAQENHQAYLARQEQLADEIGRQVVDPGRLMRNADLGTQVTFGLGSALGEMFSSNGRNSYLDRVDQQIKQDIEAQVAGNDAKRESYKARSTLFDKMLAESDDRRLAGMQTQKMMYDAIDKKLTADAARLGVPEIMTKAQIKAQEYRQKSADLSAQIAAASLQQARSAAAAQAAAQRAAEDRLRQHTIEMIKLDQEQQKIEISKGGKAEDINKQTQSLGKELADKELATGRAAIDASKQRIANLKPGEGLPGVSRSGDIREGLRPMGINTLNPLAYAADAVAGLNDEERVARSDWERMKTAYIAQISGSGVSDKERVMLTKTFEGARTPAEQRNAVEKADSYFRQREDSIKAGYDPAVRKLYEQRRDGLRPQLPPGAKEGRR